MEAETKYAKSGDVHIAYRVFGNGPRDIILVPGTVSHVELYWELPVNEYLLKRLTSHSRVIVFDKRGQGLSDRVADQTLEERVGDVLAVMNAAGSSRATIYGWSEGGQMSLMFTATHPERVSSLVLYGTYATIQGAPWAVTREKFEGFLGALEKHWGEGILARLNAPSRVNDKTFLRWFGRLERAVASPSAILALMRANYEIDVSNLLPSIKVPTLIFHRVGDALVPVESGRQLAREIPGAKYVELPGDDHLLQALDQDVLDTLLDELEEFVTGRRNRRAREQTLAASAEVADSAKQVSNATAGAEYGSAADAIAELERCREILASADDGRGLAAVIARAEAVAAAARGSWKESEEQFVKAAETFRRLGMVWQEAQTFQTWSHALRAGADRRASIEKLDKAIDIYRRHGVDQSWIESLKGGLAHTNGNSASGADHDPASDQAVFRREGEYWTVSWRGNVVRLKDAKGLAHIAYLLANPGREFMACELAAAKASNITSNGTSNGNRRASIDAGRTVSDLGDAGAMLDAKAREQYRVRIGELREEMAEAAQHNDTLRAARLRSELETLRDQIVAAVGLGGRNRKAASHRERARLMVTKAIKTALAKIRARDASLGRYLATSIKTGNRCSYDPGPTPSVYWRL